MKQVATPSLALSLLALTLTPFVPRGSSLALAAPAHYAPASVFAAEGRPYTPLAGDYTVEPEREGAFQELVARHAPSDAQRDLMLQGLAAMKEQDAAAYQLLVRVSGTPAAVSPDVAAVSGYWWSGLAQADARGQTQALATLYHEYIHAGTRSGNDRPDLKEPIRLPGTHWYASDGAWLGVYNGQLDEWFTTREILQDIDTPQDFDRTYLDQPPGVSNNLHTILDELNAYTHDAELQMALYDALPHGGSRARYNLLRELYHLELYLARLQGSYPAAWNRLVTRTDLSYLVKGLWDRAWDRVRELEAYPELAFSSEMTEGDTQAHADSAIALFTATGLEEPASLDPASPDLAAHNVRVMTYR